VLLNLAVHFIDIFLWKMSATDRPVDIHGTLARFDEAIEVDDLARLTITTESGAVASIEAGYSYPSRDGRHINYVVRGTDGLVSADRHGNAELVTADRATNFTVDVDSDHYYGTWVTRLLDGLDEGFEELATIDDLVAVRRVTDLLLDDAAPSRSLSTRWRRADAVPEIH
jgi:predicted dehydrogenase